MYCLLYNKLLHRSMIWVHSHFHKDKKYKNKVTDEKVPFQLVQFKLI